MEDLFRSYWWLLFPLSWFVIGGWNSLLNYRRHKDTMELMRTYVASGKEPPPDLVQAVSQPIDDDWGPRRRYRYGYRYGRGGWASRVVFFAIMCAGFAWASREDIYGAGQAFSIVAFVMGAITVATLVSGLVCMIGARNGRDRPQE